MLEQSSSVNGTYLVSQAAIVLQDVVFRCTRSNGHLLGHRQNVLQAIVRQLMHLGSMVLGNDQAMARRAWANVYESDDTCIRTNKSKALVRLEQLHRRNLSIDDLAEDAVSVVRHLGNGL